MVWKIGAMLSTTQWFGRGAGTLAAILLIIAGTAGCEQAHSMAGDKVYEIEVSDIVCQGCAAAIGEALKGVGGVEDVLVDVATKRVSIGVDSTEIDGEAVLRKAIIDAGYAPVEGSEP